MSQLLGYGLLALSLLCLVLSYIGLRMSARSVKFALLWILMLFVILLSGNLLKFFLKRRGVSRRVNQILSFTVVLVMTLSFFVSMTTAIFNGSFSFDRKVPADTVYLDGWTMNIYDDTLPLNIEDLRDTGEIRWSKEADHKETFLLSYSVYAQNHVPDENQTTAEAKDLEYYITDVKIPLFFDAVRNAVLASRQDDVSQTDKVIFTDHFEPIDPSVWGADEAYQLHWSDTVLDTYIVCWDNRIAEVKFYWGATEDDIRKTAEILKDFSK